MIFLLSILAVVRRMTLLGCGGAVGHVRDVCCVSALLQGVWLCCLAFSND